MKNINIFCYGFGQVAKSFVNRLSLEGFKVQLSTTNRSETTFNKIGSIEYKSYKFENNNFDEKIIDQLKNSDHVLISIPPKVLTLFVSNMNGLIFCILISEETKLLASPPHNSNII